MATVLQVKWVDQSGHADARRRIHAIGGDSGEMIWKHTQEQAVHFIEERQFDYYLKTADSLLKLEVGKAPDGFKYLKAKTDNGTPHTLLNQPGFPLQSQLDE